MSNLIDRFIAHLLHGCAHDNVTWPQSQRPSEEKTDDIAWQRCLDCGRRRVFIFDRHGVRLGPWVPEQVPGSVRVSNEVS